MMRIYHYVREGVENNQPLIWITTTAQVADMGTKIWGRILLDPFEETYIIQSPRVDQKIKEGC
jgi:hypothetical protein